MRFNSLGNFRVSFFFSFLSNGVQWGPMVPQNWKNWRKEKTGFLTPCGTCGGFDKTEKSGNTLRNLIDPGYPMFCITEESNLELSGFEVNWNSYVLGMALKIINFVQSLSRTPLFCFTRNLTTRFSKNILQTHRISRIQNLEIWKSQNPGSLTSAQ